MPEGVTTTGLALLALVALGGLVGLSFAVEFRRRRLEAPGTGPYVRLMLASAGLSFSYFALMLASSRTAVVAADYVYLACSLLTVAFFIEFAFEYTGNGAVLTPSRRALLYGYLGVYLSLIVTNQFHGLLRTDVTVVPFEGLSVLDSTLTPLMWSQTAFIYGLVTVGLVLLGRFLFASRNIYRKQTAVILLGGVVVGGGNALHWLGLNPVPEFDPTALLFAANGLFIGLALVRYDFLEVVPLAADMLIEEMDDPVIVVDDRGAVLDVNAAGLSLFDGNPVGESLAALSPTLADAVESGHQFTHHRSGRSIYDPRTTPIEDPYGIERGTLVVLRDVTVQVNRQEELERQNERLEEFASVVSHDLRNPLSVAHAYARTAVDEGDVSFVEQTLESLDRMDELIGDLLTLAREGQTVDAVAVVSVADLARQAWDQVDTDDATLVVESDATVPADDRRLRQLFENLFRNAVEHAGPAPTVTVGTTDDGTGFFVADDGPGIPAEDRETVFEHGYTSSADGTGFGLTIVRTIAEAHGWTVTVDESDAGGARFVVNGVSRSRQVPA